jgi:hypothetical protein
MKTNEQYHADVIWLSRLVEWGSKHTGSAFLSGLLVAGWIPVVATVIAVDPGEADRMFLIGQTLACLMVVVGPFDVWYFDQKLLPGFFKSADERLTPTADPTLSKLSRKYDRYYARYWWANVAIWVVLVLGVFVVSQSYFEAQGITTLLERGAYLVFFLFWLLIAGLRTHAALITVLAVKSFAEEAELDVEPLHPDGLGGLSTVGELAIQVTLINSLGSFALPLSFELASEVAFGYFVYVGVFLFILNNIALFGYPTYKMNRRAQQIREQALEENKQRIRELESQLAIPDEGDDASIRENQLLQMEIRRARQEFRDNQNVQLYPLSISIITKLVSSIILPILFILFDIFISDYIAV